MVVAVNKEDENLAIDSYRWVLMVVGSCGGQRFAWRVDKTILR